MLTIEYGYDFANGKHDLFNKSYNETMRLLPDGKLKDDFDQ